MTRHWACILGWPVEHSLSPAMHNAAFADLGIDAVYELCPVPPEKLAMTVSGLRDPACLGASVTAPHKLAVMPFLDGLTDEARLLGAVNTIVHDGTRLRGDNTDARGLQRWFAEAGVPARGRSAVVLGAGGAARATVVALARSGATSIRVLNRTRERADALVSDLQPSVDATLSTGDLSEAGEPTRTPAAVIVNATSLGHVGQTPDVHPSWTGVGSVAVDLAYNPPETPFLRAARRAGARTENGLGMLVHQGVLAFACWTGRTSPARVLERAALAHLTATSPVPATQGDPA